MTSVPVRPSADATDPKGRLPRRPGLRPDRQKPEADGAGSG